MEKDKELSRIDCKIIELRVLAELLDFIDIKMNDLQIKLSGTYFSADDDLLDVELDEKRSCFRKFKDILVNYI